MSRHFILSEDFFKLSEDLFILVIQSKHIQNFWSEHFRVSRNVKTCFPSRSAVLIVASVSHLYASIDSQQLYLKSSSIVAMFCKKALLETIKLFSYNQSENQCITDTVK